MSDDRNIAGLLVAAQQKTASIGPNRFSDALIIVSISDFDISLISTAKYSTNGT